MDENNRNETKEKICKSGQDEKKNRKRIMLIIVIIVLVLLACSSILIDISKNMAYKPIIYLYPENTEEITVKVGYPGKFTCVYPEYDDGWTVIAEPDGTLTDKKAGREYYSLYYECENTKKYTKKLEEGFVVSKENIVSFLEQKLSVLGLNERESEEFIIYWLPKLQQHKYIYVRFQTLEEIEENMPLILSKTPDTLIRIMMEWKGLNEYIEVKEQELTPVTRKGFTVVEWGATVIK